MKKIYSVAAKLVRWMVVGILSFIIATPAVVSLIAQAKIPVDKLIEVSYRH
jgi:hypothetical protein